MRKLILAAAMIIGSTAAASAADMRMPTKAPIMAAPVFSWSGFYIGGHAGYGWGDTDARWDPLPSPAAFNADPVARNLKGAGFVGGVHLGYNWQFAPQWLLGIEADWTSTSIGESQTQGVNFFGGAPAPPASTTLGRDVNWLASFRARVGLLATPSFMLYATGGLAIADIDHNGRFNNNGLTYLANVSLNETKTGWVAGAGAEWALSQNWLLRGEYLYYQFDGASALFNSAAFPTFPIRFSWGDTQIHTLRAGLSYKF
jgi:outer membrane immunogenic protein